MNRAEIQAWHARLKDDYQMGARHILAANTIRVLEEVLKEGPK